MHGGHHGHVGKPAMLQLPERYAARHYAAGLPNPNAIHVGHVHAKDAAVAPSSALTSSNSDSTGLSYEGSMAVSSHQSALPLLPGGLQQARSGPAGSTASSSNGDAHSAIAKRNELHAAAAAEAEARAASLAAMWETGKRGNDSGSGRGVAAAAAPKLARMDEEQQQDQLQQQVQQQPGADGAAKPAFARIFSSPFAHNINYLPPLASTEPSASYAPPSGVFGPAALLAGKQQGLAGNHGDLHRVDEMSGTLTRALAAGDKQHQQQKDVAALEALQVATSCSATPPSGLSVPWLNRGPPTPCSKEHSRQAGYASSDSDSKRGSRVSWLNGLVTQFSNGVLGNAAAAGGVSGSARGGVDDGSGSGYSGLGDTQMSALSGLTGMSSWAGESGVLRQLGRVKFG
jgi:hypothetical protein